MTKQDVLDKYIEYVKKYKRYPTRAEFKEFASISRETVRSSFGNYENLKKASAKDLTGVILDISTLDKSNVEKTINNLKKHKRFVITTAVSNAKINEDFYKSIKTYCKKENATLIVMPSTNKGSGEKWTIATELKDENIVFFDLKLNSNLAILGISSNAKSVDPISGLPSLSRTNGSIICPSPKQNLRYVATGINKLPHALMSTGAISSPEYSHENVMRSLQSYKADSGHIMGAIIVELDKDDTFHFRQVQADDKGGFCDLDSYYNAKGKTKISPDIYWGDYHVWETNETVKNSTAEFSKKIKANRWLWGDVLSGLSCNPHEMEKRLLLAKRAEAGELNIDSELHAVTEELNWAASQVKEVIVIRSNHDDFLDRYLESGAYVNHPNNHRTSLILALDVLSGLNPMEEHCKRNGLKKNVKFLKRDESFKIANIECGQHGDRGQNGARATLKGLEESYGAIIVGHSHTAGIKGQAFQVGTSTELVLAYNSGASSWTHTHCLIFPNGNRQLVNCIEGRFTTRDL